MKVDKGEVIYWALVIAAFSIIIWSGATFMVDSMNMSSYCKAEGYNGYSLDKTIVSIGENNYIHCNGYRIENKTLIPIDAYLRWTTNR